MLNEAADASALGAAFIGMKALGKVKNITAAKMFLQNVKTVKPSVANHRIYKKYFAVYSSLYGRLKDVFAELTAMN